MGKVPYQDYKLVLQVSSANVYLTYPFVLSWSCLEAMASGCLMVAGDTAPVREVRSRFPRCVLVSPIKATHIAEGLRDAMCPGSIEPGLRPGKDRRGEHAFSRRQGQRLFASALAQVDSHHIPKATLDNLESPISIGEAA